jgi:hypothetical protein
MTVAVLEYNLMIFSVDSIVSSFTDELEKLAVRLRVVHGTNKAYSRLSPRHLTGKAPVFGRDPNPSAVYLSLKRQRKGPSGKKLFGVERFARDASAKGGTPMIAHAKVDTKKGWMPTRVTKWGRDKGLTPDDLEDIVVRLDDPAVRGADRASLWRTLNKASGAIQNVSNPGASVRVRKYKKL